MGKEEAMKMMIKGVAVMAVTAITAMVMVRLRDRKKRNEEKKRQCLAVISKFATQCGTPVPKLWSIADDMTTSLVEAPINKVVSYVAPLPTGEEKGLFYGINVRGTSFSILSARLRGKNEPISHANREEFKIPSIVMAGSSQELFEHIASELAEFIKSHGQHVHDTNQVGKQMLGFTFTYPPDRAQSTYYPYSAIKWKNFSVDDIEAKELVDEINEALDKHGLNMHVFSLVDDTVGDLTSGRYYNNDTFAAINLGMEISATYVEQAQAVSVSPNSGELVVNVDWGGFTSSHLPVTEYDKCLDAESLNPGCRIFEKLVSGMYMGEIVRKVLLKMAQQAALFGPNVPPKLSRPNLLRPQDLAAMHQDISEKREVIDDRLTEIFGISNSTQMARELVAEVCDIVAERGARLAGAGILGIMKKLERIKGKKSVVIVQGALYEEYRVYRNYLHSSVWEMLGNELSDNVVIQSCHAGSGAGSLFLAASQSYNS